MKLKPNFDRLLLNFICLILICGQSSYAIDDENITSLERDLLTALNANEPTSYLQLSGNSLELAKAEGAVFEFQKIKEGLPILGNRVTVYTDESGVITRIVDDSTENLVTGRQEVAIESAAATRTAEASMANLEPVDSTSQKVWFRVQDTAIMAWEIHTRLKPGPGPCSPTDLYTVVDATTGVVLSQTQIDKNTYLADPDTGTGVFPRIVINDAVGPAGSQAFALNFPEVCDIPGCTATLIAPNVLISARHCGIGPGGTVNFGPNSSSPTFSTTVQSVSLPAGAGSLLDGGDVAIVTLNANVPSGVATPMRFIDETTGLVGMTASMAGYGLNGVGSSGHGGTSDGLRWGGQNVIDVYGSPASSSGANIISTDFDNGTGGNNTIGGSSPSPLTNEATTAPGDSGGPVIVNVGGENLIAGVLSGGTSATSQYGDISWWTGTAVFRTQIEAMGGTFAGAGGTPPPNDNFANTVFVDASSPFSTTGTNVNATTEPGEQELTITGSTVWWFFVAPETGMFTVNTFGSDFDTVLHIYEGFFAGAGVADLIPVANNDQAGGTNQSEVTFPVVAGECYEIRVGGYLGDEGNIVLNSDVSVPPPANDDFSNTIALGSLPFNTTGTNVGATTEPGEQELTIASATVWWFFTAPGDGTVVVDTFGSDFDTVLHIYEGFFAGATVADLIPVTNNDQAGGTNQSQVTFMVNGGDCYEIRVGGFFGATGNIDLNGAFTPAGVLLGDVNLDGVVNLLDVAPFVDLITSATFQVEADINEDGFVDLLDVAPFIAILAGA